MKYTKITCNGLSPFIPDNKSITTLYNDIYPSRKLGDEANANTVTVLTEKKHKTTLHPSIYRQLNAQIQLFDNYYIELIKPDSAFMTLLRVNKSFNIEILDGEKKENYFCDLISIAEVKQGASQIATYTINFSILHPNFNFNVFSPLRSDVQPNNVNRLRLESLNGYCSNYYTNLDNVFILQNGVYKAYRDVQPDPDNTMVWQIRVPLSEADGWNLDSLEEGMDVIAKTQDKDLLIDGEATFEVGEGKTELICNLPVGYVFGDTHLQFKWTPTNKVVIVFLLK